MLKAIEGSGLRRIIQFFSLIIMVAGFMNLGADVALALSVGTATSGGEVSDTCDVEFMKSLETRAWLEGEREVVQNENLIVKADSVTELTCFSSWLDNTANDIGLFSEGLGPESLDDALENLVTAAWAPYVAQNFKYKWLGGRFEFAADHDNEVNGRSYTCSTARFTQYGFLTWMSFILEQAKCYNFQPDDQAQDGFFDLKFGYVDGSDPRVLIKECEKDERWAEAWLVALAEPPWMPEEWLENERPQYLDLLDPDACGTAVPTGVTVRLYDGTEFPDAVCPPPGCRYDRSSCRPF
ncbi:MAG: hypothetical protein DHS20C02_10140 [Micavibrio sp.]|nr:MAG: hypothetical protein DHS20C02_10140 [Micavibrio sp.]